MKNGYVKGCIATRNVDITLDSEIEVNIEFTVSFNFCKHWDDFNFWWEVEDEELIEDGDIMLILGTSGCNLKLLRESNQKRVIESIKKWIEENPLEASEVDTDSFGDV